ncbi:S-layer homology domain-containing protein [Flintibacter faecis]|uniref:S-layer homology domain-containing protein n=1 Tax=Flintibacter faecis TaxID=2763047 RepID=A0A8J6M3C3_9FIRM|nr:S-layer homology domain-containing protein [Flintibacter faecis]MBC5716343.1 S-layer homology domain-containing protein [Flintibacter faecis]
MKKRILSCVLSAALLLGLTPWSALATDDPPKDQTSQTELQTNFQSPPQDPDIYSDPQPNITIGEDGLKSGTDLELVHTTSTHTDHDGKTFAHKLTSKDGKLYIDDKLQENYEIKPDTYTTETYYLAGDLTLDNTLYIRNGVISICLNGHSITQNKDKDVINVANDVYLSLYDCSEGNAGQITHASGAIGRGIKFSAGISNTFDMYGGTITGNNATAKNDNMGGGVLVTGSAKGSFNLRGGVITGNSAANGGGVAVCSTQSNNKDTSRYFNMFGGTISNNQANDNGGGVYVENNGRVTVSGGEIKNNTATKGGGIGGGTHGTSSGSIDASTCPPIYITVSDSAKITGNRAPVGGGIYAGDAAYGYCRFTMTGGEISGNNSVYNKNYTYNGGGVYLGGTMTVSGDAKIVNNTKDSESNNVFLPQDYTMTIGDGGLGSDASIGVTASKELADGDAVTIVSSGAASGSEGYFKDDAGTYNIQRVGETLVLVNGTLTHKHPICGKKCTHTSKHEDVTWTAINSAEALQNAAGGSSKGDTRYYYLTNDVTLDSTWTPSGYLALDLNGYTLDTKQNINIIQLDSDTNLTLTSCFDGGTVQHESNAYGRGVIVASGATFTMYNVKLTNHEAADLRVNGAGVYVNGGTFNMRSGSLVDNTSKSSSGGGGVLVDNGGTFNLYSGTISDGNAYLGAGVSVKDNSTFNMYGGTISGNKASDPNTIYGEGGGVYVDGSTFHMTGGEIKANSASDAGGGVYVKNSTFTMTGGEINGNTAYKWGGGGVYVASTSTFIVDGKVTITGNKLVKNINNVYLSTNDTTSSVITLRSGLSKDSRIGVDKAGADKGSVKFATGALSEKTLAYYKSIFSSDVDTHTYKITYKITNDDKWDLYIGAHQHTWNYTAKGNKLTAKCSASAADCTLWQNNGPSVTIEASKQTYDGSEKKATIKAEKGWKDPAVNTIPITYQVQQGNTFVPMAEGEYPTAVGTYHASISLTGVDKKTATASVEYTISKAELTADDFTFTAPTASSGQLVYDGKPKAATVTSGKVAADQITVKYYTETGSEVDGLPTNAGTYTVKINVNETESYQAATALTTDTWKFTIAKAKQTISVPQDKTLVKNGAGVDISQWVSVSGVEGGSPADKLSYALNGNYHGVTLTGSILTAEKNATANTVTIKVTAAETQNYERAEATFTVTVAAKSTETLTHVNMTGWTYGGEPNQPSYDPVSDVIENTRKTTYATKNSDGTNSTFTEKVPTAVGNYTVKVTFETASSVYTGTADFTISPKSLTQKMVSSIQDQTYCANAWEPDVVVTDGNKTLVKNSDYTVSYTDNINAGTAKVKVTGQGNYKGTAEATFVIDPAPLTITGAEVAAKTYDGTKTATINGVTFGGLVPGEVLTTDDYQITDAQFNSANVSDAKKVTVTVALKVTDKAKNYTLTSPTYGQAATISKATQNISVPQDKTLVKNGAGVDISQWVSVSGVEGGSPAGKLSYALDGNYPGVTLTGSTLTAAKNATADTVTIKVTAAATQNYEGAEATFSVKLSDKLPQSNFQFASDPIDKTYGNDSFTMTATGAAEGSTVSYKSSDTNVATVDNTGKVTIVGAGKATITATAAETKDYASASASYTLTVAQAKLTITAKDQSAYIGDKVPELGADSYTVTGLVKGESLTTALTILPTVRYVDENGQKVEPDMKKAGETVIRASGAAASGNYVIVAFTDGKLTVSARPSSGGGGSSTPSYPVSTPSKGGNGSVSSNAKNAASGSTVTITVKPDSGYQLETLAVTDHRGNALKLTDQGNGTYTFTMPSGQVDVKATFTQAADETSPFDDVSKDDYYYDAVKWAADSGITGGVGGSLFGSDQSCTRAQIVTFLWRAAGSPEPKGAADMTDVPQDAYYAKAVAWAMENGITSGTGADRFNPHAACTRAQGMTFLFRSSKASASGTPAFQDVAADAYYAQAVKWAADNGITSGIGGGLFGPDNGCTRAQIVTFLWKLYAGK